MLQNVIDSLRRWRQRMLRMGAELRPVLGHGGPQRRSCRLQDDGRLRPMKRENS